MDVRRNFLRRGDYILVWDARELMESLCLEPPVKDVALSGDMVVSVTGWTGRSQRSFPTLLML